MIKHFVKQWDERKHLLEGWLKENMPEDYAQIHRKLFELVVTDPIGRYSKWNWDRLVEIDNGSYQGVMIFIMCPNAYQPCLEDYVFTSVEYGSCSVCDTFEGICGYEYNKTPTPDQVSQFMTLALHLLQETKTFNNEKNGV